MRILKVKQTDIKNMRNKHP